MTMSKNNRNRILARKLISLMVLITFITIFELLHTPVMAQTEEEEDEIRALELQIELFATLDSVKDLTGLARDNMRPSGWIEKGTRVKGSGRLLRGAHKSLMELAKKLEDQPPE